MQSFESCGVFFKNYRDLTDYEIALAFDWRNDEKIRSFMANNRPISITEHYDFLHALAHDKTKQYFLAFRTYALGSVNLTNINESSAELGIFVNPSLIGKGYGNEILSAFLPKLQIRNIYLKVKKNNIAAINLYEKNGFVFSKKDGEFLQFLHKK